MRQAKKSNRWLVFIIAAILVVLVIPGVTQAKTDNSPQIRLQYASFDPLSGEPYMTSEQRLSSADSGTGTYLLQFDGPVREEWKTAVTGAGVRLYDYVPDYAFIARMDSAAAAQVQSFPHVRWVGQYHPAYRLTLTLQEAGLTSSNAERILLNVQTLPDIDQGGLFSEIEGMGGNVISHSVDDLSGYVRVLLPAGQIEALAAQDGVLWVEPYVEPVLSNDIGGASILQASTIHSTLGLFGSGQIVGVSDSGLDVGTTGTAMSDDFEGRIVEGQAMCATYYDNPLDKRTSWSDLHTHGTHVSGSILGNGVLSGSNPGSHDYAGSYAGLAPEARLVMQSLDSDGDGNLECIPANLNPDLFGSAYNAGARIHSNSWGGSSGDSSNPFGGYTEQSRQVDSAAWNYNDLLILYAAGNDGKDANRDGKVDPDSLGAPGTAKNALTVGATENDRPSISTTYGGGWPVNFPVDPIMSDRVANQPVGMAGFSARGPADDGRIKPDLVAPGTFIISAFSHDPVASISKAWGATSNPDYVYMGGTSMATPLTAGAATLVREWLTKVRGLTAPSGALMKAVLVNGALDISPGQYSSPQEVPAQRPNNVSGWGRVSLVNSIAPTAPLAVYLEDHTSGLSTGSTISYTLHVGGTSATTAFEQVGSSVDLEETILETPEPETEFTPEPPAFEPQLVELKLASRTVDESLNQVSEPQAIETGVSLVIDDGLWNTAHGVISTIDPVSFQFIWFNRFTPSISEYPFTLNQIWVMFDNNSLEGENNVSVGDAIDLIVYEDSDGDGDPTDAKPLAVYNTEILAVDGTNWSVYNLSTPLTINGPGDVLIAVVNRYVTNGITAETFPALKDNDSNQGRSWIGVWLPDEIPNEPNLATASQLGLVDSGNWLIRGYGQTTSSIPPTPTEPPPSGNPLRVTLAWTDYPANPSAAKTLVNDLDLLVIAPNGTRYYGNGGAYGSSSACLRDGKWDQCNNLEGVIIPAAEYGTYTIVVKGHNIPTGPQSFALVASGDQLVGDASAPNRVTDLAATTGSSSGAVDLTWTAPGDDGTSGTASAYVIKYNTKAITASNWAASTTVGDVQDPSAGGSTESLTVYGLKPGTTYYFALTAEDEVKNISSISNSPSAPASTAPDSVPPADITDLSAYPGVKIGEVLLSWTAPGDDVRTGTATIYTLHYSTTQISAANWISATLLNSVPAPRPAGTHEVLTLSNLDTKKTYYFAIKAQDEVPNISGLSNIVHSTAEDKRKIFLPLTLRH